MTVLDALPLTEGQVRVRALAHGDAAAYARGSRDEPVRRFGHLPLAEYTEDVVREQIDGVIADGLADGSLAVLAIADARSDDFLGSIVLFDVREDRPRQQGIAPDPAQRRLPPGGRPPDGDRAVRRGGHRPDIRAFRG